MVARCVVRADRRRSPGHLTNPGTVPRPASRAGLPPAAIHSRPVNRPRTSGQNSFHMFPTNRPRNPLPIRRTFCDAVVELEGSQVFATTLLPIAPA